MGKSRCPAAPPPRIGSLRPMRRVSDLRGIAAMLASTASFVVGDTFMKRVTEDLPPFEVLFLRGMAATLACGILLVLTRDAGRISGALDRRTLGRALAETASVLCYIVALASLPITDAIAIVMTAPLILLLALAVVVREPIGRARFALVFVGFVGAVLVARPGPTGLSLPALLAFAAAVLLAVRDFVGRGVPATIPVMVIAFATNVTVTAGSGAMSAAFEDRVTPEPWHLAYLAAAGLFLTFGHIGLLLAYRLGRTAVVAPFFYSFVLWGVVAGLVAWRTLPDAPALAGIALIAASGVALVLLDQRDRGREAG